MDRNALELDTVDALRGAESVRKRLLLEVNIGNPSIGDLAYAVKLRVKEDYKVLEKVERKRAGNKADYAASSLRDIVGLRIVTLYRLDALEILPVLLERIDAGKRDPDGVWSRKGIEEIIIYSTNPTGDVQDLQGRVEALCTAFGHAEITTREQTPQSYSSIHIVVWCRGKYNGRYRDVPVEIQVRTAFEDVWGEIDHSLKYKREKKAGISREAQTRLALNDAHLSVMKTLIDGLAQYGDQIKLQMESERTDRIRPPTPRQEQAVDRLARIVGLDANARSIVEEAVHAVQDSEAATKSGHVSEGARVAARRRSIADIHRASAKLAQLTLPDGHRIELVYVLEMERALLLFTIGNELGPVAGNPALVEANRIYSEMTEAHPDRPVAMYRLARIQDELNDRTSARRSYERVLELLKESDLPEGHWVRSAAPRLLGFSLWEEGAAVLRKGGEASRRDARDLFEKAIESTQQAMTEHTTPEELVNARNNLLYYEVDRLRLSESDRLEDDDRARLSDLIRMVAEHAKEDFRLWDTIRVASDFIGDTDGAVGAATRINDIITDPNRTSRIPNENAILEDAKRALGPKDEGQQPAGQEG